VQDTTARAGIARRPTLRGTLVLLWLLFFAAAVYARICHPSFLGVQLHRALLVSPVLGYGIFLLFGSLRGFTLVPSTYMVAVGLLLFPPWPLFLLVMGGIVVSSGLVYRFSAVAQLGAFLDRRYAKQIASVRRALAARELPVIVAWSAAPFLPTDVICYVAGTLRIDLRRLLLGVTIGESLTVGAYVFLGHHLVAGLAALLEVLS